MALMAREMGLPARVVLGFVPSPDVARDKEITFTGSDIQAWVEINFAGFGWVSFFPTPDESRTPRQDTSKDVRGPAAGAPAAAPAAGSGQRAGRRHRAARTADNQEQTRPRPVADIGQGGPRRRRARCVLLLGPPLGLCCPQAAAAVARLGGGRGVQRVVGGWDELLDQAADLRRAPAAPGDPPRARGGVVGLLRQAPVTDVAAGSARGRDRWPGRDAGRQGGRRGVRRSEPSAAEIEAYWAQVDATARAMRRAVPRRIRWGSRWSPASLRRTCADDTADRRRGAPRRGPARYVHPGPAHVGAPRCRCRYGSRPAGRAPSGACGEEVSQVPARAPSRRPSVSACSRGFIDVVAALVLGGALLVGGLVSQLRADEPAVGRPRWSAAPCSWWARPWCSGGWSPRGGTRWVACCAGCVWSPSTRAGRSGRRASCYASSSSWCAWVVPVLGPVLLGISMARDRTDRRRGWQDRACGAMVFDVHAGVDPVNTPPSPREATERLQTLLGEQERRRHRGGPQRVATEPSDEPADPGGPSSPTASEDLARPPAAPDDADRQAPTVAAAIHRTRVVPQAPYEQVSNASYRDLDDDVESTRLRQARSKVAYAPTRAQTRPRATLAAVGQPRRGAGGHGARRAQPLPARG